MRFEIHDWLEKTGKGLDFFFFSKHGISSVYFILAAFDLALFLQAFNNLVDNTLDDLQETFVCATIADVQQLQEDHESFKTDSLKDAETKYNELAALTEQMAELGSTDNTYTTLTPTVGSDLRT